EDLTAGKIDALVTAPINKHNIQSEEFNFPGHTEYLQSKTNADDVLMFMVCDELRIGVVTGHIPLNVVASKITEEAILKKLRLMNESLKKDFWVQKPKIAVLGLNPHAGDNGAIGTEDDTIIAPTLEKADGEGIVCFRPYPADGGLAGDAYKELQALLAVYEDQGVVPVKHIAWRKAVNCTAGVP